MKTLILLSEESPAGEWFVANLNIVKNDENDTFTVERYSSLAVIIKNNKVDILSMRNNRSILEYDLVYIYGKSESPLRHSVAAFLRANDIKTVNSESINFQCMTKLEQNIVLALNGLPVPDSLYVTKLQNIDAALLKRLNFHFPLVVKAIDGKNGKDNERINSIDDFKNIRFDNAIIQPFIPNDFDYRVIVAGDEIIYNFRRIRSSDDHHQNNIALGGKAEICDLPEELKSLAVVAAKSVGRELSALDILIDKTSRKPVILEVNFNLGRPVFESDAMKNQYHKKIIDYFYKL